MAKRDRTGQSESEQPQPGSATRDEASGGEVAPETLTGTMTSTGETLTPVEVDDLLFSEPPQPTADPDMVPLADLPGPEVGVPLSEIMNAHRALRVAALQLYRAVEHNAPQGMLNELWRALEASKEYMDE